ncbi:MAG: YeeE/YedE family protein, partial [Betaproteobacteria bacterium]|nr:YeeE/YedE family protein [Betaproteobacteria bacterium]
MKHIRPAAVLGSALLSGGLFGFGLAWSTMVQPEAILRFLMLRDMGLLLVMGGAAATVLVAYRVLPRLLRQPVFGLGWARHPSVLNRRTVIGSAVFGIGWGLSGVCPGPALAGLGVGNWPLLWVVGGILLGAWIEGRFFEP